MSKVIVTSNGCFDLLHVGHLRSLEFAKSHGDVLIVGINSDDSIIKLKGAGRPIFPAEERAELLLALEVVDDVVIFSEPTPENFLRDIKPRYHCKGADYIDRFDIVERELLPEWGGQLIFSPLVRSRSTTLTANVIAKLHL